MSLNGVVNIEDLHQLAKKRLPKIAFDFIEGGVEDERALETNRAAFHKHQLLPRYLVDVSKRDQSQTIFGRKFNSPFGISPTGTAGLFRRGADLMLAEAAREANIPYIQSGGSNDSMEAAAKVAPHNTWYQLYAARDGKISEDLVRRAADCGLEGLVLTVDVPVRPRRERNIRNGFAAIRGTWLKAALSLKPAILAEAMQHPGWIWEYVSHGGTPNLDNWKPYAKPGATVDEIVDLFGTNTPAHAQTWRELETYRKLFPRNLIVKGLMNPSDAIRAADIGCEGIIVSNHGGRNMDSAAASLDVLPEIAEAVGDKMTLILDSGVRRGSDIVKALALGAKAVLTGRATLNGTAVGGEAGALRAINILTNEADKTMAYTGCRTVDEVSSDIFWGYREGNRLMGAA